MALNDMHKFCSSILVQAPAQFVFDILSYSNAEFNQRFNLDHQALKAGSSQQQRNKTLFLRDCISCECTAYEPSRLLCIVLDDGWNTIKYSYTLAGVSSTCTKVVMEVECFVRASPTDDICASEKLACMVRKQEVRNGMLTKLRDFVNSFYPSGRHVRAANDAVPSSLMSELCY